MRKKCPLSSKEYVNGNFGGRRRGNGFRSHFFADGSNSIAFVRSVKQQRREEKKYASAPVHNIPPPLSIRETRGGNIQSTDPSQNATRLLQNGLDFSKDPAPGI